MPGEAFIGHFGALKLGGGAFSPLRREPKTGAEGFDTRWQTLKKRAEGCDAGKKRQKKAAEGFGGRVGEEKRGVGADVRPGHRNETGEAGNNGFGLGTAGWPPALAGHDHPLAACDVGSEFIE